MIYEEENLYSTGYDELDDLMEKAFCDGYYYAQKEYANVLGKIAGSIKGAAGKVSEKANSVVNGIKSTAKKITGESPKTKEVLSPKPFPELKRIDPHRIETLKKIEGNGFYKESKSNSAVKASNTLKQSILKAKNNPIDAKIWKEAGKNKNWPL